MSDDAPTPDERRAAGPARGADRPYDPAGTRPKHRAEDLLPADTTPLLRDPASAPEPRAHRRDGEAWATLGDSRAAAYTAHEAAAIPDRDRSPDPGPSEPVTIPQRTQARLQFVLGALLATGAAGLAVAALIAFSPGGASGPSGPRWSEWRPDGDGKARVSEIASRVGRQYRGDDGSQLVVVTGGPLEVAGLPLTVALREPAEQGGDIELEEGKGILYRLCGLGEKCAIATGKPSRERHLLLRREALELALYTFHYVDADQVVVFMPPRKGRDPDEALFFKRSDLEPQIEQPLARSLAPRTPSVRSVTASPDSSFVNDLTIETLFNFSLTQGNQDNRAFLVLDPLGTSAP